MGRLPLTNDKLLYYYVSPTRGDLSVSSGVIITRPGNFIILEIIQNLNTRESASIYYVTLVVVSHSFE